MARAHSLLVGGGHHHHLLGQLLNPLLLVLLLLLGEEKWGAEGAASGPLLGGAYQPTTDVAHVVTLSQLVHAISVEDATNGTDLYRRVSFSASDGQSYSLEGIFNNPDDDSTRYVDATNNPLYGIYMHSYWKSSHGSTVDAVEGSSSARDGYIFLDARVDVYGATVIENMLAKATGYDPRLTAEAIRSIGVWMAFVQALYNAVSLCAFDANADGGVSSGVPDVTDPGYVSPVDVAAAFWIGSYDPPNNADDDDDDSGSLYAWSMRARSNFGSSTRFDANDSIVRGLSTLQPMLPECLAARSAGSNDEVAVHAKRMRTVADDIVRYATVPMVQNLIHHSARLALGVVDTADQGLGDEDGGGTPGMDDAVDWIILYGLSTIAPIRVCDEFAFDDLYGKLVYDAKSEVAVLDDGTGTGNYIESLEEDVLYDVLNTLYGRLTCLGLSCEHIGVSNLLATSDAGGGASSPTCADPVAEFGSAYPYDDAPEFTRHLKIDMDVRTIGILVEMDANDAAYDVYRWGRHMRRVGVDESTGRDVNDVDGGVETADDALHALAIEPVHERNSAGAAYASFLEENSGTFTPGITQFYSLADAQFHEVTMKNGRYFDATPAQRRTIVESTLAFMTAHVHALNGMYEAVESCRTGATETTWDQGFTSLTGWAEEDEFAHGFLMMALSDHLCDKTGNCPDIKSFIEDRLGGGKTMLRDFNCDGAELVIMDTEKMILTLLVDAAAYYADQLSQDGTNADHLADGHVIATALVPQIRAFPNITPDMAEVIERNIGGFGSEAQTLVDGVGVVIDALMEFVVVSGIDCELLTMRQVLCPDFVGGGTTSTSPNVAGGMMTTSPNFAGGMNMPSPTPFTSNPTTIIGGPDVLPLACGSATDSGLPGKSLMDDPPPALFGGLYQPKSNVDHIVKLTETLNFIASTMDESDGLNAYNEVEDGISLQCLSMGVQKDFILRTNPLFVIYMFGLWSSEFGSSDPDEWSNKLFFDADVLHYGETIVNDEFNKASGYDGKFTVETIQLMNMWMAMTTEMYRAAGLCHDGAEDILDFNPVDFAAALWFGTAQDADSSTDGSSLYAWAKRAAMDFVEQSISVTDEVNSRLTLLQTTYSLCKELGSGEESKMKGIEMKHMVDEITWLLTVPLVQHFIHHLAIESGMTDQETTTERNHMVLYALSVLPLISICDKSTSDDLFFDLIISTKEEVMLDSTTFSNHIGLLQDKYKCLGISCDMVGVHTGIDAYPQCNIPNTGNTFFAGYQPNTDESLQLLNIDHDISTMLAFIVMEADSAALDIFHNGRNAKSSDGSNSYLSLDSISNPTEADPTGIYASFTSGDNGRNYLDVTLHAIEGVDAFSSASVFKKSAGASLAIATINLQMLILLNTHEAVENCSEGGSDYSISWDRAVAAFVGSNEGTESGGSDVNGFLLFQLAQELCAEYDSCEEDGEPLINKKIMELFTEGQEALISGDCDEASVAQAQIESLLQAIVIDLVAYHAKLTELNTEEIHCTMAHVASFALLPMMRRNSATEAVALAADTIEGSIGGEDGNCQVLDVEAVYQSLYAYVQFRGIDCAWLGSSVCNGTSTTTDSLGYENNDGYTPSPGNYTLFNEEYEPTVDVTSALALSSVVNAICTADDSTDAKNAYSNDATVGLTIESMSLDAKYVMLDELQFHQYIYALQDGVDETDGSRYFDGKSATEYANTITSDALDTNILLGCQSMKVLNIWMWIVHKLNSVVDECRGGSMNSGLVDEAAALWEGGQLYAMAEELGPKFLHDQDGGMTYLNRRILDRLKKARDLTSNIGSSCGDADVHDLRIIVKETVSYMTAVLIQSLIDSMTAEYDDNKNKVVELMAFAVLPHIKTCGHEVAYNDLHDNLILASLSEDMISPTIETLQSHYNCLGLSCDDVGLHDGLYTFLLECSDITMIAGYQPENATKTNMVARLDLDAVAIHQLTSMDKFELAKRIYTEGHNYYDYDNVEAYNFVSLYNLTQGHTIGYVDFPIYSLYEDYNGPNFSNELITSIFDKTGLFEIATPSQRGLAIKVAISGIVSYMAVLEAFYSAASRCDTEKSSSIHAFDGAVALLIGSVEGQGTGGSLNEEGQMFYSIAKRNCNHFNDCLGSDSRVNEDLFLSLTEGQDAIRQGLCGDATNAVDTIDALLKVPLVQSLLYFSDPENVQSDYDAAAYVAMKAVLPTIINIDPDSAENIKAAMSFDGVSDPNDDEIVVHNSLKVVLSNPNSGIDCELVMIGLCDLGVGDSATDTPDDGISDTPDNGVSETPDDEVVGTPDDEVTDVIPAPPDVINPEDPTPIPFVTSNYVGDRSAIALDMKQIQSAISANDFQGATQIYNNGRNSKIYNENGIATGELRSIARFSTESAKTMKSDPTYNLFIYGLSDDNQEFMGRPTTVYADTLISNLLVLQVPEGHTAMVAITIWMQVVHSLHSAYGACRSSFSEERRGLSGRNLQRNTDNDPSLFIDEAAAYWMGDNQDTGSSSQGHLLYALTEFIADKFETPSESESTINLKVIDLFNKAKNHIAISRSCSTSEKSHLKLKGIVDELIPLMAVPLLRCLLYHLSKNELTLVKVYATAVLPLFSACASATYRELKSLLIDPSDLSLVSIKKDFVVLQIQSMYSCLGLTCDLVGSMMNDDPELALPTSSICDTNSDSKSLAGYKYVAEQEIIDQASLIDIDIRKIEIFLENRMIHFPEDSQDVLSGAAFDLYKYGQQKGNDNDDGSLRSIARSTNRDVVPIFTAFRRYFDNDDYYADTMITSAFQKQGAFSMATPDQRKRFISFALRYMVTFMAILEKVYLAFKSCSNEETRGEGAKDLDIAIAYYMGSLEGKDDGGSYDGSLIHMLANRMCVHFGTCSDENNAVINERIMSLVYAGQGELEMGACTSMERTVNEIENALIVPLIQGVLFSARENELHFKKKDYWEANQRSSMPEFYPEGYALAQAILPVIAEVDQSAATNIKNVMVVSFPTGFDDANSNDSAKVHRAMKSAVSKMVGMDCSQIGSLGGVGFCAGDNEDSYDALNSASGSPYSFAALLIAGVLLLVYI